MENSAPKVEEATSTSQDPKVTNPFLKNKIILIAVGLVVLLIVGWVVFGAAKSKAPITNQQNDVLVTVGNSAITKSDLDARVTRKYKPEAINGVLKRKELEVITDEKILENEASVQHISLAIPLSDPSYYGKLRQALVPQSTQSIEAYTISYSVPSNLPTATTNQLLANQKAAFGQSRSELELGGDPYVVAQRLVKNHPQFAPYLMVNGSKFVPNIKVSAVTPQIVTATTTFSQIPLSDVMNINKGQAFMLLSDTVPAALVIRALDVKNSSDYESWLTARKKEIVKENLGEISKL